MFAVISPAKKLNFDPLNSKVPHTMPGMLEDTLELMKTTRTLEPKDLSGLMKISDNLAELNYARFQNFSTPFTTDNSKQAVLAFNGDTYTGLDAATMKSADLKFAQKHLGILSGLYGLLKPLDLMQPYRLEMGTRLKNNRGKDLYAFWGESITDAINEAVKSTKNPVLVNLASNEYFKSVKTKTLVPHILTPVFKEIKNGEPKIVSFMAKRARGMMARYIIDERLTDPEGMKDFTVGGYTYREALSTESNWVFTRPN